MFLLLLFSGQWIVIEVWGIWCYDSCCDVEYVVVFLCVLVQDFDVFFMFIYMLQNVVNVSKVLCGYDLVGVWFDEKGWDFMMVIDLDVLIWEQL